jgi:hypothetical protein
MISHERRERGLAGFVAAVVSAGLLAVIGIGIGALLTVAAICAVLVLGGCTALPTIGKTEIVRVKEEVPVKCAVKDVPVPKWPLDALGVYDADIWTLAKTALAEVEARIAYETELTAANRGCK